MVSKRYEPLVDKLFWIITIPTVVLLGATTVFAIFEPMVLLIMIPTDLLTFYFLVSPLFGYVELREDSLFIKYGLILKKEIPYEKIRGVIKKRSFMSYTTMSLKNAYDHLDIKYNKFDVTCVSVVNNDEFKKEIEEKINTN